MQGWKQFIPTEKKIEYLNVLLQVGFDTVDFGSFVSPKAIPQMADTHAVLEGIRWENSRSRLLAIVANRRGAEDALKHEAIRYLGFPFSISETFQVKNTRSTIAASLVTVNEIQELCRSGGKELVIYISMGFGNPYGDPYDKETVAGWVKELAAMGIRIISLADTVGMAAPDTIAWLFSTLLPVFPGISFGAHFHSAPHNWEEKIEAAWQNGCRRFDSAIRGIGGCPMAAEELVGNIATENLLRFFEKKGIAAGIDEAAFREAELLAGQIFENKI